MATMEFCLHLTHKLRQETLSFMCTIRFSLFYLLGIIYTLMSTVASQGDELRTQRRTLQDAVFSCWPSLKLGLVTRPFLFPLTHTHTNSACVQLISVQVIQYAVLGEVLQVFIDMNTPSSFHHDYTFLKAAAVWVCPCRTKISAASQWLRGSFSTAQGIFHSLWVTLADCIIGSKQI